MAEAVADRRRENLRRMVQDFDFYARHCLKVLPKAGGLPVPFVMNRAQRFLHEALEKQLRETGRVRALVLKGRQQGACLDPATRVLTADLQWVRIDSLSPGQELVATDEEPHILPSGKCGKGRKLRTATVEAVVLRREPSYRITLDDGRQIISSGKHRWLVRKSQTQWAWRSIDGETRDSRGGIKVGDKMRSVTTPWGEPEFDDGWFGGMIDGEGSFERRKTSGGLRLAVSQRAGAVLDRMLSHCDGRGYGAYVISDDGPRKTKHGQEAVHAVSVSSVSTMFRLMGLSRPTRFIGRHWWDGMSMPDGGERTIVAIEPLGERDVVDIQTSTGTFIAEGIVSHNSTYIQGRFRWRVKHRRGRKAYVVAHEQKATDNLFVICKRYHDCEPPDVKPSVGKSDANTLWFNVLDSRYEIATAGTKEIGRSGTAQYFHASEYAFWANAESHWAGIGQVVPSGIEDGVGTEIIVETTGNGVNNDFYRRWNQAVAGKGEYIAIFIPWYWDDGYRAAVPADFSLSDEEEELVELYGLTNEQLQWRRNKIDSDFKGDVDKFRQEYPCCPAEAFAADKRNLIIPVARAQRAQRRKDTGAAGAIVAGLDVARFGDDSTALVVRHGRKVLSSRKYDRHDTMEVVGIAVRLLTKNPNIAMLFVDMIGIGAGVVDRLHELGYEKRVIGVNFASKASDEDAYVNKRSECWGEMAEWIKNASIPEGDEWLADVTSTAFKYDSRGRIKLEPKEDVKKLVGKSPDLADSLALTFAEPVILTPKRGAVVPAHVPHDDQTGY